ncbi:MAG: DUF4126 domain-containing protein [Actinomycetota bacterium]|nr:DUF4126 domain-containing protein [Actinomycetota bacterium]
MDLVSTLISSGWASGVNAYLTVVLMGLLGRAGVGDVPEELQTDGVLIAAAILYAIEFVVDKVPLLDSAWDTVHTIVRPAIASAVGVELGADAGAVGVEEVFAGGGAGAMALASHAVKAGIRLAVNTSPEPASNIFVSLLEDGLVAGVTLLALEHPVPAAIVAVILLVTGIALAVFLAKRIRRAARYLRARWSKRGPP